MNAKLGVVALVVVLSGCGGEESESSVRRDARQPPAEERAVTAATGTRITLRGSDFGRMLWGPGRQAIYIFENDRSGRSRCYGDCAEAWPPVFTKGKPRAGDGVRKRLLGTTTRRDGRKQVTYAGKPLYYYAHEGPGEVLCHDVFLNGGYWWAVGAGGRRLP